MMGLGLLSLGWGWLARVVLLAWRGRGKNPVEKIRQPAALGDTNFATWRGLANGEALTN